MNEDKRTLEVLLCTVDLYVETRLPVGSRSVSKGMGKAWSPATLRNIMSDLEKKDFLTSLHRSSGRIPTGKGIRLYLQSKSMDPCPGMQKIGNFCRQSHGPLETLKKISQVLSDISQCSGVIFIPAWIPIIHSIDFLALDHEKAIVVLVTQCGRVEHRIIDVPQTMDKGLLQEASNYLNARISGYPLDEARELLKKGLTDQKNYLHFFCKELIERGIDFKTKKSETIITGQNNLLHDIENLETLQTFKALSSWLEKQESFQNLFDRVCRSKNFQLFVGMEDPFFDIQGCALVMAPYCDAQGYVKGGVGVMGLLHMDYRKIVPIVTQTAKFLERTWS